MTHQLLGQSIMAEQFPLLARRETRTDRKQYKFRPSVSSMLNTLVNLRGVSETDIVELAVEKEIKSLPVLDEVRRDPKEELALDHVEKWVNVGDLYQVRTGDYFLRAHGPSLTGECIGDKDLVLIRPQSSYNDGDTAVVILQHPTPRPALRRIRIIPNSKKVELISLHDAKDIVLIDTANEALEVVGVMKGITKAN